MASIFIDDYCIDYSIVDGSVRELSKRIAERKWETVTENYEQELIALAKRVVEVQKEDKLIPIYSTFLYRLAEEGKLVLPRMAKD